MGKLAFVFPGQASQYSGMGLDVHRAYPEAASIFQQADEALGFAVSEMCFKGTEEELKLTENTQPAILTVSVAVLQVLEKFGLKPDFVAGHSLGEYSALVAARALSFRDAAVAVRKRGRYMQEAVPVGVGAMAAILGAELQVIQAICESARGSQVLSAANINSPGQIVVAGHHDAVLRAVEMAKQQGYRKAVLLPVSAPFHCSLMEPARERLAADLRAISFSGLQVPLVNNVDAALITSGEAARDSLIRQVTGPVLWQQSMELMARQGVDTFIEVGPKTVLTGMIKKIVPEARTYAVEKLAELDTLRQALNLN